jgi:dolichol-phosphate mannosyltransferase
MAPAAAGLFDWTFRSDTPIVTRNHHGQYRAASPGSEPRRLLMRQSDVLIFTTCYNERENIGLLIDRIAATVPSADILVVDDSSPDGTWEVIQQRQATCRQLYAVSRPKKLGIGSAHKYALFYAMREGYQTLVTMDADFSHDPALIPSLLVAHGDDVFVTGSRYCPGGSSDYSGYRDVVSRIGNRLARLVLGVHIHELTTYFRVFDVASLRRLPLRLVTASGYSYGVELVYQLQRAGVELREVPIHFSDRTHGASKIPRLQILKSALDLFVLGLRRFTAREHLLPDERVSDACTACGDRVLAMKHSGSRTPPTAADQSGDQRRVAADARRSLPVYTCLACGLEQIPQSCVATGTDSLRSGVVDVA